MRYRELGRTGFRVSELGVGTVSLGMEYGIRAPGDFGRPSPAQAGLVIRRAVEAGINLFDTAPAYGDGEAILGEALKPHPEVLIATKVSVPRSSEGGIPSSVRVGDEIERSLRKSLRALQREVLDVVQVHNATEEILSREDVLDALKRAQRRGMARAIGASVYSEAEALSVIRSGEMHVLQVAYSILDQRMARTVFRRAQESGVGVLIRSALLKGALSHKARELPEGLEELRAAAARARDRLAGSWEALPDVAVRFCLSASGPAAVLVGPRTRGELDAALRAAAEGPLDPERLKAAGELALLDDRLLNPSRWSGV